MYHLRWSSSCHGSFAQQRSLLLLLPVLLLQLLKPPIKKFNDPKSKKYLLLGIHTLHFIKHCYKPNHPACYKTVVWYLNNQKLWLPASATCIWECQGFLSVKHLFEINFLSNSVSGILRAQKSLLLLLQYYELEALDQDRNPSHTTSSTLSFHQVVIQVWSSRWEVNWSQPQ